MGTSNANKVLGKATDIYPELPGWGRLLTARDGGGVDECLHTGYTTSRAKQCPCCGRWPVFERSVDDRSIPAKVFVAICPRCEMHVEGSGTLEEMLTAWNDGEFTNDTIIVHHRMRSIDKDAAEALSSRIVADAVDEAVCLVEIKNQIQAEIRLTRNSYAKELKEVHLKEVLAAIRKVQAFIDSNPMMLGHDPDAILSLIRRKVYPNLSFEDRQKIPLKLVSM